MPAKTSRAKMVDASREYKRVTSLLSRVHFRRVPYIRSADGLCVLRCAEQKTGQVDSDAAFLSKHLRRRRQLRQSGRITYVVRSRSESLRSHGTQVETRHPTLPYSLPLACYRSNGIHIIKATRGMLTVSRAVCAACSTT